MRYAIIAVFAAIALSVVGPARPQTPSTPPALAPPAENLAAARELIEAAGSADTFKAALPILMQNMKNVIVQNRPQVEKKYNELMPRFNEAAEKRLTELANALAVIYASNFSVDELHQITAFFRSPVGKKYRERLPTLLQESMAAGQGFGRSIADDVKRISGPL